MDEMITKSGGNNGSEVKCAVVNCPVAPYVEPWDDVDLINQWPNLLLRPEDPDKSRNFEERYSVLKGEAVRFKQLLRRLGKVRMRLKRDNGMDVETRHEAIKEASWRALHEYYADTYRLSVENYERDKVLFADAMNAAKATLEFILEEYFPFRLRKHLETDSSIAGEHDPITLMKQCAKSGSDIISRIRRFEARRQLTVAQVEFELRVNHGRPEKLDADMMWFVRACESKFFIPGRSEQMCIIAELDPDKAHRVSSFRIVPREKMETRHAPDPTRVVLPIDVRFFEHEGREVMVYFEARVKRHVALKLIAKRERHHEALTDLLAAKFVFFDEDTDLMAGIEKLRRALINAPGSVSGEASNAKRAGALDPGNSHSSEEYRARKYDVRLMNMIFEMQFMYAPFYVNELVARGRDNHQIYKLGMYLDKVFPVLFPKKLYGLDWRDHELREELMNFQLAKI